MPPGHRLHRELRRAPPPRRRRRAAGAGRVRRGARPRVGDPRLDGRSGRTGRRTSRARRDDPPTPHAGGAQPPVRLDGHRARPCPPGTPGVRGRGHLAAPPRRPGGRRAPAHLPAVRRIPGRRPDRRRAARARRHRRVGPDHVPYAPPIRLRAAWGRGCSRTPRTDRRSPTASATPSARASALPAARPSASSTPWPEHDRRIGQGATNVPWPDTPGSPIARASAPAIDTVTAPSVDITRTGGDAFTSRVWPDGEGAARRPLRRHRRARRCGRRRPGRSPRPRPARRAARCRHPAVRRSR